MSKKNISIIAVISISLVTLYFISFNDISTNAKEDTLMDEFENLKGESIVIEEDEFDFYSQIVRKKIDDHSDEEKIKKETIKYIQDVYAQFLIGNYLDVSSPYSFEALKIDMEQENNQRKIKQEKGEEFYGLVEFELEDYIQYTLSNLQLDIIDALIQRADESLVKEAEEYLEANPEQFTTIEEIEYEINREATSERKTITRSEMSTMEKVDSALFYELFYGEEGTEFQLDNNGESIEGKILTKTTEKYHMEDSKNEILKVYITRDIYDELIRKIGEYNPIKLDMSS